jgi:glycosyltransferase involved in cell wall biosynthesis
MLNLNLIAPFAPLVSQPLQPVRQQGVTPQQANALPADRFNRSQLAAPASVAFGEVATAEATLPAKHPDVPNHVHTMAFAHDSGKNGLYFTTQIMLPGYPSGGGLGVVSAQTPMALNKYYGKDVRPVLIATKDFDLAMKANGGWQDTGEVITVDVPWKDKPDYFGDKHLDYKVHQYTDPASGLQVYALTSHNKVALPALNTPNARENYVGVSDLPADYNCYSPSVANASNAVTVLDDLAMTELGNRLDPTRYTPAEGSTLKQFDGKVSNWIVNDWLTGPMDALNIAAPDKLKHRPDDVGMTFIVHNRYDKTIDKDTAKAVGLETPSLLNESIKNADVVLVDPNFMDTMQHTEFLAKTGQPELKTVLAGLDKDNIFRLHHGYGDEFNPFANPTLAGQTQFTPKVYQAQSFLANKIENRAKTQNLPLNFSQWGFSELAPLPQPAGKTIVPKFEGAVPRMTAHHGVRSLLDVAKDAEVDKTREAQAQKVFKAGEHRTISQAEANHLLAWKSQQKEALQQWTGLKQDPEAVVYSWTNRFDAFQKLFDVMVDELPAFMAANPKAQFVTCADYNGNTPRFNTFLAKLKQDYPDRVALMPFDVNAQKLVSSGSDFSILPSLYEPYGTAQLQAMVEGAIPIASDIDGLRTTVCDPAVAGAEKPQPSWAYGQSGIMLPYTDPTDLVGTFSFREQAVEKHKKPEANDWNYTTLVDKMKASPDSKHAAEVWTTLHNNFRQALDRSMHLAADPNQHALVMKNGMDFMQEQHNWETIAQLYLPAFAKAEQVAQQRQA